MIWVGLFSIVLGFILMPGGPAGAVAPTNWTPFVAVMGLGLTTMVLMRFV